MVVKLIALDLDGTTLNSRGQLTRRTKDALDAAIDKGVNVVIATGRCFCSLPDEINKLSGLQYTITSNGAQIRDFITKEAIYNNCIDSGAVIEIEKTLRTCDQMIEIFIDGRAYIEKSLYESIADGGESYRHRDYVLSTRNPIDDIMGYLLEHKNEIENINIFCKTQADKARWKKPLSSIENVTMTTSLDSNWELGGATTSKANALAELCCMLDVKKEEILACGDSPNDGDMLREAGIPVAVGNAKPEIKEIAVYVAGTNNEDGVAEAIEKYVL